MPSTIHCPGMTWQSDRRRACGSINGVSTTTVLCQKLPPTSVKALGVVRPMPSRPSWVSAPPTTTGVPAARPVSAAALAVTPPSTLPGWRTFGKMLGSRPINRISSADQVAFARSNRPELAPIDGSVAYSPESFVRTQSLSMPMWAMRPKTSGWCRLIQRNLAGEVMETQSPPVSKIFRASPGPDQLGGLVAGARVDVRAGPDLGARGVVQDHALAHGGARDALDGARPPGRSSPAPRGCTRRSGASSWPFRTAASRAPPAGAGATIRAGPSPPDGRPRSKIRARQLPVPRSIAITCASGMVPHLPKHGRVGQVCERLAGRQPADLGGGHLAAVAHRLVTWRRRCEWR